MRSDDHQRPGTIGAAGAKRSGQGAAHVPSGRRQRGQKLSHGLAAMGAAAVVAVYAAGYARTQSAAEMLEEPEARRRPGPAPIQEVLPALDVQPPGDPVSGHGEARLAPATAPRAQSASLAPLELPAQPELPAQSQLPGQLELPPQPELPGKRQMSAGSRLPPQPELPARSQSSGQAAQEAVPGPQVAAQPPSPSGRPPVVRPVVGSEQSAAAVARPGAVAVAAPTAAASTAARPTAASIASPAAIAPPAAAASSTPAPATAGASAAAPPGAGNGAGAPAVPAASAVQPAPPAAPQYKDGTYTGWGTSRHGDIEATVVIAGGRIASATISKCWTRYPCSWIVKLPPQVAERQSPEVDYVSGATQSTNAFYYAVVEALSKAK